MCLDIVLNVPNNDNQLSSVNVPSNLVVWGNNNQKQRRLAYPVHHVQKVEKIEYRVGDYLFISVLVAYWLERVPRAQGPRNESQVGPIPKALKWFLLNGQNQEPEVVSAKCGWMECHIWCLSVILKSHRKTHA